MQAHQEMVRQGGIGQSGCKALRAAAACEHARKAGLVGSHWKAPDA